MAGFTLADIETKVRRLTRSPSTAQLSQADLDNYINTFVLYDFPEHLRTFNLRTTFNFWCQPFQDVYPTNIIGYGGASSASQQPLYNFQNRYLTIHPPVYIAGFPSLYSQSQEQFYNIYPKVESIAQIAGMGDGTTTTFSGFINANQVLIPQGLQQQYVLLRNNVTFASVDINLNGLAMIDVPILDSVTGNPTQWGNLYPYNAVPSTPLLAIAPYPMTPGGAPNSDNFINYVTGQFNVTFPTAPLAGQQVNSESVPQIVSMPQAMLYYNNKIILRPVPDQPYQVNFECYIRPTELIGSGAIPELEEYWQLIAYGASRKILQDRLDMDSVQLIEPEYREQMRLCLRRTLVQYANESTGTIYTNQTDNAGSGWGGTGGFGSGGGF